MNETRGRMPMGVNKLVALAVVIVGLLILAVGFTYNEVAVMVVGGIVIVVGLVMLALKIARRNSDDA